MCLLPEVAVGEAAQQQTTTRRCLLNTRVRQFVAFIPFDNYLNVDVSQWSTL